MARRSRPLRTESVMKAEHLQWLRSREETIVDWSHCPLAIWAKAHVAKENNRHKRKRKKDWT